MLWYCVLTQDAHANKQSDLEGLPLLSRSSPILTGATIQQSLHHSVREEVEIQSARLRRHYSDQVPPRRKKERIKEEKKKRRKDSKARTVTPEPLVYKSRRVSV